MSDTLIGLLGALGGMALSALLYKLTQTPGAIAVQSLDVSMIGSTDAVFPDDVTLLYKKEPVPNVTSSFVWIWNAGRKTMRKRDIVENDRLRLHYCASVLNVRSIRPTRKPIGMIACQEPEQPHTVSCSFEFLEPGDGAVFEVLHSGPNEAPAVEGTIIDHRKPKHWGRAWGAYGQPTRPPRWVYVTMGFIGIAMTIVGAIQFRMTDFSAGWEFIAVGVAYALFPAWRLWSRRRRFPPSLVLDSTARGGSRTKLFT